MADLITATGVTVTHDESAGLQNFNVVGVPGDANDNDVAAASLPSAFTTRLSALLGATAGSEVLIGAALSGYDATHLTGQNVVTLTPTPGGTITGLAFTDSSGAPLNGVDSGKLTADGDHILLYTDGTNNNILIGRAGGPTGDIVFAAYIEETSLAERSPAARSG